MQQNRQKRVIDVTIKAGIGKVGNIIQKHYINSEKMKLFSLDFLLLVTAQYGNQNSAGSAFGDPHFMVVTEGQEPLCFDFNPPAGSNMTLIMDPVSNLIIVATVEDRSEEKSYMTKIHFVSPGGAQMNFDTTGVHLSGLPKSYVATADEEGKIAYGDVNFVEHWSEDGTRDKIIVEVTDGPSFLIKEKVIRGTLSFGITDTSGLSEKVCHY